ncbi:MAG: methyltransferase domain-containing protein, partial [Verrucomicrobiota bacterium]
GEPALKLAKAKGCRVDGVTISNKQHEEAVSRAESGGMADRVQFINGDATKVDCEDAIYDGGWFFESIFHMGHAKALKEAGRIMKPGAVLLVADFIVLHTTTEGFLKTAREEDRSHYIPKEEYYDLLDAAGFEFLEFLDVTKNVVPSMASKVREAFATRKDGIEQSTIDEVVARIERMSNNLGYLLVTARRVEK